MNPNKIPSLTSLRTQTRRRFLQRCQLGLGAAALSQVLGSPAADASPLSPTAHPSLLTKPRAKSIIYLHMEGSPPQHETFDYKPELAKYNLQDCPQSFIEGKKFAFIKGVPKLLGPVYPFKQYGQSGAWVSDKLPHLTQYVDDICFIKSVTTDQFNHAPAQLLLHTGTPQFGGASIGSWVTYGLGSENADLPGYIVMISGGKLPSGGKSLWGSGYLPSVFQGVQCRSEGDPVLYVGNPEGMSRDIRRTSLDALAELNQREYEQYRDPETLTRINQYELAFRMQTAVPEVMDISREPQHTIEAYGATPGGASFANNCLLARRLVEQGVRFVQLFDWGWDVHGTAKHDDLITHFPLKCKETDQAIGALLADLKARGMLDDTLVVCGGEFGRTPMVEARSGSKLLGRDHQPECFTVWLAGGGAKPGITFGETDELGFKVAEDPVHVRDLQATVLHLLGLDPHRLVFPFQGLNQRLIGPANDPQVRHELIA